MKKILLIVFVSLSLTGLGGFVTNSVSAATDPFSSVCEQARASGQPLPAECTNPTTNDPISGKNGEGILIKATRLVALVTGIASVIMIIIGGISYTLSSGDSNRINSAKNTILYAIIGLIISIIAASLITFVFNKL